MQHGDTAQAIRRVHQAARAPGQRETSNLAGWQSLRRVPRAMAVAAAASQGSTTSYTASLLGNAQ